MVDERRPELRLEPFEDKALFVIELDANATPRFSAFTLPETDARDFRLQPLVLVRHRPDDLEYVLEDAAGGDVLRVLSDLVEYRDESVVTSNALSGSRPWRRNI
jgi:hypothetical protein